MTIQSSGIITLRSLDVDGATGMVLNEASDTIPGLRASGRNAVGLFS